MLKTEAAYKLWLAKNEPRAAALLFIQFAFAMMLVLAVYAYLDPDFAIVQWEKIGLQQPLSALLSIVVFLIAVAAMVYLYRFTETYRKERKKK